MISKDYFINKYYGGLSDDYVERMQMYFDVLVKTFGSDFSDMAKAKPEDIIEVATTVHRRTFKETKFLNYKSFVLHLFDELPKEKFKNISEAFKKYTIQDWYKKQCKRLYFKDLDNLIAFVRGNMPIHSDTTVICILILCWYGYSVREISDFKTSDIDKLKIENKHIEYLKQLASNSVIKLTRDGKDNSSLVESEFLFSTRRTTKMQTGAIERAINSLNEEIENTGKHICFDGIFTNGIYYRAFINPAEERLLNYTRKKEYEIWKAIFQE